MADFAASPGELVDFFRGYDPTSGIGRSYQPGSDKEKAVLDNVRRRYEAQVSEVLSEAEEFAERLD